MPMDVVAVAIDVESITPVTMLYQACIT